jgi:hypothetical protein
MRESSSHNALELGSIGLVEIGLMQIDREFYRKDGIWSWTKGKWSAKEVKKAEELELEKKKEEVVERATSVETIALTPVITKFFGPNLPAEGLEALKRAREMGEGKHAKEMMKIMTSYDVQMEEWVMKATALRVSVEAAMETPMDLKKVKAMKAEVAEFVKMVREKTKEATAKAVAVKAVARVVEAAGAKEAARRSELAWGREEEEKLNVASKATMAVLTCWAYANAVESLMENTWRAAWTLEKEIKRVFR